MPDHETIEVGARVRLRGDYGEPGYDPLWMTVLRKDDVPAGPNGPGGTFISLGFISSQDGGSPVLGIQAGIMVGAVTKQKPAPAQPTKRRAR